MNQKIDKSEYQAYKEFARTHTKSEIMEKFDVSSSTVDSMRWKYGFSFQPKKVPTVVFAKDMEKNDFVEYCKSHTLKEIRNYFDVSSSSVYSWEKKYNFKIKKTENPREKAERNSQIVAMSEVEKIDLIAKKFGLSKQRISQIIKSYNKKVLNGNN